MAPSKRAQRKEPFSSSSSHMKRVQVVRYIKPLFVETDVANFKAVVQSLTGHDDNTLQTSEFLNNVVPPHSNSHSIPEIDNVAAEVEVNEMAFTGFETGTFDGGLSADLLFQNYNGDAIFEGCESSCVPSFMGFETGIFDSFYADILFQNCHGDAFEGESSCVPSFMGFETEIFDSFNADNNMKDAFDLPPFTISTDIEMSWDSFLWPDYQIYNM
ncbi:hypothetical protein SUGI_0329100 [Cryptomeria japonica]|nr:hypothetical protein SUGI_0329100 [Cryptomeria japonica]